MALTESGSNETGNDGVTQLVTDKTQIPDDNVRVAVLGSSDDVFNAIRWELDSLGPQAATPLTRTNVSQQKTAVEKKTTIQHWFYLKNW